MPDFIEPLRARLVILGCPVAKIRRLVREAADHREDLKQAGLAEGLSEAEAEGRANELLGDPVAVAERMMETVRHSSWWGRHCAFTFGVLPLLTFPVLWSLILLLELLLVGSVGFGLNEKKLHAAADNPYFLAAFHFMDFLAIAMATLLFCWLARRAAVKLKWMVISCVICSVIAVITVARLDHHIFSLGFSINFHLYMPWYRGAIPLLAAGAAHLFQQRAARHFQEAVAV